MLIKELSSTILKVFGMTQPGIEPRFPGPLANTLPTRVFTNGLEELGSIPGRVIPKTQKMVLDASLLNTQHYKVRMKDKVEQSRERSNAPPHLGVVAIEKGDLGGARGVMVIVVGNGHGNTSSNPGRD